MATQEPHVTGAVAHGPGAEPAVGATEYGAVGMPQLDPAIWPNLIFWLVVSIVLLHLIMSRVALPRLSALLAERQDAISNDLEMAALLRRRAQEAEGAYEKALADAREEASRIGELTRANMQSELKALTAKADAQIAAKSAESEQRIGQIRDGASQDIEAVARDTAQALTAALMPNLANQAAIDAAVRRQLKG